MQSDLSADISPVEVFHLFVTNEIMNHIVIETNRYASQSIEALRVLKKKKHHLSEWTDTSLEEMKKFFGLLLWMGIVNYGSIAEYWSTSPLLQNQVASNVMPRNRFQMLLSCFHFNDNRAAEHTDRLYKIRPIVEMLQTNFQQHYTPGESRR